MDEDLGVLLLEGSSVGSIDTQDGHCFLSLAISATFGTQRMIADHRHAPAVERVGDVTQSR